MYLKVRSGTITAAQISISPDQDIAKAEAERFDKVLKGKDIQDISNFKAVLDLAGHESPPDVSRIATWLNFMLEKASNKKH